MTDRTADVSESSAPHTHDIFADRALGFWVYMLSDAVIFALLFATYAVMVDRTAGGPGGGELFDLSRAFAETMLLLASSVTFGFASIAVAGVKRNAALAWLAVTFVIGVAFIGMEFAEFGGMIAAGAGPDRSGFLSAFFTLVGTHGLHVSGGLLFIVLLSLELGVRGISPAFASRLLRLGLFWHFLDIVWIGIFSIVYLPGLIA